MKYSSTNADLGLSAEGNWAGRELDLLSGSDPRMVRRLAIMLEDWAAQPQASIVESSRSKAAVKASYRLLANARVNAVEIAASHCEATWQRMGQHQVVLAVADTTSFNHSTHPGTEGLGAIGQGNGSAQGFWMHSVVAFSEQGEALGVLHAQCWARDKQPLGKAKRARDKNSKPLAQRESHRWTQAYEAIAAQRQRRQGEGPRLVMVADRESDIYELFVSNAAHDEHCAVLVRALHPRRMQQDRQIVWEYLEAQPELGRMELQVPAKTEGSQRTATLALRCAAVQLGVPHDKARLFGATAPLALWAIEAVEVAPPAGTPVLHWKLLSSVPAADLKAVKRQLRWYARRWGIEVFHRTLKSGCKCETRQLRSLEKLQRALGLDMIVAWRLMALRDAARQQGQQPAAQWLEPTECEVLTAWAARQRVAIQPTLNIAEAVRCIARFGGYLDRKSDPPPGTQVLWRGLHHLHDMAQTWLLARQTCG